MHILMQCLDDVILSYNALERRETCKGGKDVSKKSASSQSTNKTSTAAPRTQSSQNARRNEVSSASTTNQPVKASRPSSSGGPAYEQQVIQVIAVVRNF